MSMDPIPGEPDRTMGAELRGPATYPDGTRDYLTDSFDLIADLAAAKVCRECSALFVCDTPGLSKWATVCTPCLRAMGCL